MIDKLIWLFKILLSFHVLPSPKQLFNKFSPDFDDDFAYHFPILTITSQICSVWYIGFKLLQYM